MEHAPLTLKLRHNPSLRIVQITRMRMLQAILRHKWCSHDPISHQILPKIENPLGHGCRTFGAIGVLIPTPHQLRQRCGPRPHLPADDGIIDLLGPEWCGGADYVGGFGGGEVRGEVVVVDLCILVCIRASVLGAMALELFPKLGSQGKGAFQGELDIPAATSYTAHTKSHHYRHN
jgi:hypothetical protein